MNGLLVFNNSNDIVFKRLNNELHSKLQEIAKIQGLIDCTEELLPLDNNVVLQIFSPIINSQKIMFCQFDNTYQSFQCDNGLNFAFGDFLGYAFVKIGTQPVDTLRRNLSVCISFAKHLYGPNLFQEKGKAEWLDGLIETYEELYEHDQGMLLESMPQLLVNSDLKNVVRKTLESALEQLKDLDFHRSHAIMFVHKKYMGTYSSRQGQKLSASDVLFISLLCQVGPKGPERISVFFEGDRTGSLSGCIPCVVNISRLDKGGVLVLVVEYGPIQVASSLYDTFFVLQKILNIQMQGDSDSIKPAFDNLEMYVKQTMEAIKKAKLKSDEVELSQKKFASKWENLRKIYTEFFKTAEKDLVVRIESNMPGFQEELKDMFTLVCLDTKSIQNDLEKITEVSTMVEEKLLEVAEFLSVKAERNVSIESYLEEFPGLVHFIFINRSTGTMIAPDMPNEKKFITEQKIWSMVELTRSYLRSGQTSVMWKDTQFNYSYFLWFEDQHSGAMKPVDLQSHFTAATVVKPQLEPGILATDFYQSLIELCFPKVAPSKVKCYELYCIHLGLVTATCAVEHCRRLVATISDVVGDSLGM